jgi:PDZ domain-containing protein
VTWEQPPSSVLSMPATPQGSGLSPRVATIVLTGVLSVVLGSLIALLPVPYAVYGPGPVTNVLGTVGPTPLIRVEGRTSYPSKGTLDMTTVEVFGGPGDPVHLPQLISAWISRSQAVMPVDQVFPPGQTSQDVAAQNQAEMSDSQLSATAAGLRLAGLSVPETITVADVGSGVPAAGVLRKGDVITGVDGVAVSDSAALRARISALKSGAAVSITLRRGGATSTVSTTTTSQDGRTILGVNLAPTYRFPVQVKFATRDVGGPSAGMMFALGIYDLLTPGPLSGDVKIAGTGTIDGAGQVGPIGGIAQKLVGARDAGATWFIAPGSNCNEVVGNVPDGLRVVRTDSLKQSLSEVQAIAAGAGGGLPTCG